MPADLPVPIDRFAAQSGQLRQPGARAMRTRQRIVDAAIELLNEVGFKELSTTLVAQRASLSPPAPYRYFADITDVLAGCTSSMRSAVDDLVDVVEAGDWRGPSAVAAAEQVISAFRSFWARHRALYRVVELLADEGDPRFVEARQTTFGALTEAFTKIVERASGTSTATDGTAMSAGDGREPNVTAGVLVATLIHVTAREPGFAAQGIEPAALQRHLAAQVATVVTGSPVAAAGPGARRADR